MNRIPEQKELIRRLKKAYNEKGLSLNKVVEMMPEDSRKLGKTTCQKLFNRDDAEYLNFSYNTLIFLAELLLDSDKDDEELLLKYKKEVIDNLDFKIVELQEIVDFRTSMVKSLEKTVEDLRKQNTALIEIVRRQMERCDNCEYHVKE